MDGSGVAKHRTIVLVDVERFSDPRRTLPHQRRVRDGMYRTVREALKAAGVPWDRCHWEDRGDSVFVLVPADIPKAPFVEILPGALTGVLREHNLASHPLQQIRLRLALHAGEVAFDEHGVTATSVTTAFRLLDAEPLRTALATSPGNLAMIVSEWMFEEVVRHSAVINAETFRRVQVAVKKASLTGWISLPDHPYPADAATEVDSSTRISALAGAEPANPSDIQRPRHSPALPAAQDAESAADQLGPTVTMTANTWDCARVYQAGRDMHITERRDS